MVARIPPVAGSSSSWGVGAGNSSLLQAGLMRKLAEGQQVPGSKDWPCIMMTPTADSLTELAGLAVVSGTRPRSETSWPRGRKRRTSSSGRRRCPPRRRQGLSAPGNGDARLVLIVDQFEQLFTLDAGQAGKAAQQALINVLCAAARQRRGRPGSGLPGYHRGTRRLLDRCVVTRARERAAGGAVRRRADDEDRFRLGSVARAAAGLLPTPG